VTKVDKSSTVTIQELLVTSLAQTKLGLMYETGTGVTQDYVRAHMWYNLVVAWGNQTARKNRDIVTKQMTPAQIAEANRLARDWKPKKKK
jgi:hypothetical protein